MKTQVNPDRNIQGHLATIAQLKATVESTLNHSATKPEITV